MVRIIIYTLLLIAFVFTGSRSFEVDGSRVPALMSFMNPFTGFWNNAAQSDVIEMDDIAIGGVEGEIIIAYDERQVPHIFANSYKDALSAQGYLHAKHRLFQMEISHRDVAGTLAEILGPDLIDHDREKRHTGIVKAAEETLTMWEQYPEGIAMLDAYLAGVNEYIGGLKPRDYPIEFKLIGFAPEKWTRMHCALFQKNMAIMLASRSADIENTNFNSLFGMKLYNRLFPDWYDNQSPIIPIDYKNEKEIRTEEEKELLPNGNPLLGQITKKEYPRNLGSNNWAIGPSKSSTNYPILCNDPHLGLSLPSIWYESHIHSPEANVYGVSIPSLPGIIIGFNEHIAWGVTNVGHDVTDWYAMDWVDTHQTKYRFNGQILDVDHRSERIKVKGGKDIVDTVKYSVHGPIIPFQNKNADIRGLAMKWMGGVTVPAPEMLVFPKINAAKDHDDFQEALNGYICPAQNFVYADIDGNIAMHVNGVLPNRKGPLSKFVKSGSQLDSDWQSFIPRPELPKIKNPKRGFVSSANQHSTYPNYPYYYYSRGFEQYRGRRINQMLTKKERLTLEDMKDLQYDDYSLKASDILPTLLAITAAEGITDPILAELAQWDYRYLASAHAPTYFEKWYAEIKALLYDEIKNVPDSVSVNYPQDNVAIDLLINAPNDILFDRINTPDKVEDAQDIVLEAFRITKSYADSTDQSKLQWANYNVRDFKHLARIDAFSKNNIASNGSGDTPNANNRIWGPSWRMIVELDPEKGVRGYGVLPGGQDGRPNSEYYTTGVQKWVDGQYFDLFFPKTIEEAQTKGISTLKITPQN